VLAPPPISSPVADTITMSGDVDAFEDCSSSPALDDLLVIVVEEAVSLLPKNTGINQKYPSFIQIFREFTPLAAACSLVRRLFPRRGRRRILFVDVRILPFTFSFDHLFSLIIVYFRQLLVLKRYHGSLLL
jgi:hypothetical protein